MSRSRILTSRPVAALAVAGLLLAGAAAPAAAEDGDGYSATALSPDGGDTGAKSASGALARSDEALLARTDDAGIPVMVKVDVDPVASYAGGVDGYPATSPERTGRSLAEGGDAVDRYTAYVQDAIRSAQDAAVELIPQARLLDTYVAVYGGFSLTIPADRAKDLLSLSSVAAVQGNNLHQRAEDAEPTPGPTDESTPAPTDAPTAEPTPPATAEPTAPAPTTEPTTPTTEQPAAVDLPPTSPAPDADSSTFVGADAAWPAPGGRDLAGQGVLVGVIDTGIWPEHPMLRDAGIPAPAGGPWDCQFGDGQVGPDFACNDKLAGAYAFLDTYQSTSSPAGPEDYCDGPVCSARDAEGHGTHTATTAAGSFVDSAEIFGVDRGAISGIAPGASVIAYRALGPGGGYDGDLVAAIGQAVLDGVDVINYSISGSGDPYDATELAFLDAFAAGITVNSSAGNSGPGASTLDHASPWTTTVGASTFDRAFTSALVLTSADGQTLVKPGTTITDGVSEMPVVAAQDVPGYDGGELCETPFPADSLTGTVVLCFRGGNGRVEKGYNASLGGAAGMILANPEPMDLQTDNHFLPAIQLEGPNDDIVAFLAEHPGATATWARGEATVSPGDVMAAFSSRGPVGEFLKPDVTAPGVQILAGNTPTPTDVAAGPPGELYQAIAGTSMSAPHAAGVSALVKAAHPSWTPGQIKSALMTSSVQSVVNVDGSAAGVFDRGAGSIRADRAVAPTLTVSETSDDFYASAADPLHRIDLNIPSVYADPLPGAVATTRTVTNVTGAAQSFRVTATGSDGLGVRVVPDRFTVPAGGSRDLTVILDGLGAADGWHEGQITITGANGGVPVVLPVAANVGEAPVSLTQTCEPTTIARGASTTCTVSAANLLPVPVQADIRAAASPLLRVTSVTAPATRSPFGAQWSGTLDPALAPTVDSVAVTAGSSPAGFLPLADFGVPLTRLGDEEIANFSVPAFAYGAESYTRVGVVSNGYLVVGGGTSADVQYQPDGFPGPAAPNNVLAPLWTDLNPEGGGGIRVATLSDASTSWLVVEWSEVPTYSSTLGGGLVTNSFQAWIQLSPGAEGVWFTYGADAAADANTAGATGAENRDGTSGAALAELPAAGDEVQVLTSPAQAGGAVTFDYTLKGLVRGTWSTVASLGSLQVRATPLEQARITVR